MADKIAEYQRNAVVFFKETNKHKPSDRSICGDDPGIGKTLEALLWLLTLPKGCKLWVTRSSLKINVYREIKKWKRDANPVVFQKERLEHYKRYISLGYEFILIMSGDEQKHFLKLIKETKRYAIRGAVWDECHDYKDIRTNRTLYMLAISSIVPAVLLMSGTPLVNEPLDMYSLLKAVGVKELPSFTDYRTKVGKVRVGMGAKIVGGKSRSMFVHKRNIDLSWLNDIVDHVMIRRTKEDVKLELPEKRTGDFWIQKDLTEYNRIKNGVKDYIHERMREYPGWVNYLRSLPLYVKFIDVNKENPNIDISYHSWVKHNTDNKYLAKKLIETHIAYDGFMRAHGAIRVGQLRKHLSDIKVDSTIELAKTYPNSIIFCDYLDSVDRIAKALNGYKMIADTPMDHRHILAENVGVRFKYLVTTSKSGGVGLNAVGANFGIFHDTPWSPAIIKQCGDRMHRRGQKNNVLLTHIYVENTIDESVKIAIERKYDIFRWVTGSIML